MSSPSSLSPERQLVERLLREIARDEDAAEAAGTDRRHDLQEVERPLAIQPMELTARDVPQPADRLRAVERGEGERLRDGQRLYRALDRAERLLQLRTARLREWLGADYAGGAR